jgi:hypothetical protein
MMRDRERNGIDRSHLTPAEAALVDEFAAALEQAHEAHVERMRRTLGVLELLRDGVAAINADMRAELPELPEGWLEYQRKAPERP